MVIVNVNHKECTCDLCGAKTDIDYMRHLPYGWERCTIGKKKYRVCESCFVKVDMAIEDLKVCEGD